MTSTRKAAACLAGVGALALAGYFLARQGGAPAARGGTASADGVASSAGRGEAVLAGIAPKQAASGRFAGEWEQTSGTVTVRCNGKVAKEVSVAGKHFKVLEEGGALRFSDNACEFPLKVDGAVASAASDTCVPKNSNSPPVKIIKQSLETSDGRVAKIAFEGKFEAKLLKDNESMACTITAESSARRL